MVVKPHITKKKNNAALLTITFIYSAKLEYKKNNKYVKLSV